MRRETNSGGERGVGENLQGVNHVCLLKETRKKFRDRSDGPLLESHEALAKVVDQEPAPASQPRNRLLVSSVGDLIGGEVEDALEVSQVLFRHLGNDNGRDMREAGCRGVEPVELLSKDVL
jgi:hypothetical protein